MIPGSAAAQFFAAGFSAGGGAYEISRSLRFNSSDSAYLSRTPASAGNRRTWTWAGWVKLAQVPSGQNAFFNAKTGSGNANTGFDYDAAGTFRFVIWNGSGVDSLLATTQVFRDFSAWLHLVVAVDTTQATASDRVKMYANGTQITAFSTSIYPSQNYEAAINLAQEHNICRNAGTAGSFLNGYLADVHFIDGQALDPTSFTEVDATTGQLVPIAYSGTYGTNGFHLPFSDNSTAAALGTDTSGNSNTWTVNNISVAAGAGNDSLVDTPTSYGDDTGAGGEVRGNYCTLNPLRANSSHTLSNGNLDVSLGGAGATTTFGTFGVSTGKWYWEMTCGTKASYYPSPGVNTNLSASVANQSGADATGYQYMADGQKFNNSVLAAYGASFTTNDVIGMALNMDAGTITFYKNGVSQGQAYSGITGTAVPTVIGLSASAVFNFGQRPFAYTAPSGYKALCTTNLPDPVVAKPSEVMDVALYTGNGSTQTISGLGFSPDLVWIKQRDAARSNHLFDIVRGTNLILQSDKTDAEITFANTLTSFNADGFTLGSASFSVNAPSPSSYVAWTWDAGSSTVTNTDGSITSSVRANASAGFSVVAWTKSPAGAHTVGHGLGVAPQFVIVKSRSLASEWAVYHASLGATKFLKLNTTDAAGTVSAYWNDTAPTSTTISLGSWSNLAGDNIAYCFAPVAGYSSFGSYTGNGSADGPMIFTGFKPAVILLKSSSVTGGWEILDYARDPYNVAQKLLQPNQSLAEVSSANHAVDFLSNGFKIRTSGGSDPAINTNGSTVIYAAWASNPFKYARAR